MVEIELEDLLDLIHWARRYCDGRATYAPSAFNNLYSKLLLSYPFIQDKDPLDITLTDKGKYFPWAQDGMFDHQTGAYDAIPKNQIK
jgi:hypothetical protein